MAKTLLAHVREDKETGWQIHSLTEHLEGVSELAALVAPCTGARIKTGVMLINRSCVQGRAQHYLENSRFVMK